MSEKRDMLQGEGDRVEGAAREAKRTYEEDPEELEAAEEAAKAKAATHMPAASNDELALHLSELGAIRDGLKVRMHLAKKEAQELFATAEEKWHALAGKAEALKDESKDSVENVGAASKMLVEELRESYKRLKSLL